MGLMPKFRRIQFLAAMAAICFIFSSGVANAKTSTETSPGASTSPPAATGGSCTISCSGSPEQVAHCMTSTELGGEKSCHASGNPCTGNYFVATGSSESGNDYTRDNAYRCLGQWQFCAESDAKRFCASIPDFHANKDSCQDKDIIAYTQANIAAVKAYVGQSGPAAQNVTLTGLLGVAHLCGAGGMVVWMKTGICPPGGGDAGGTSGTMYYNPFKNTVLPPELSGAAPGAACPGSSSASTTPTDGATATSSPAATSYPAATSSPAAASSSPASSGSDMMSQMMPMMMMMQMMQMMQQMSSSGGSGSSGSSGSSGGSGSSSDSPLSSMISQLMSALQSSSGGSGSSSSGSGAQQEPGAAQDLQQQESEAAAQQQPASSGTPTSAVVSQPDTPLDTGKKDGDYRLSCPHHSADHTLEGCRSYSPTNPR